MKANTNKKNKSASRKLVPAVAMLTTSAVMLSSATYAWFTLNKEVEVTGLSMSATASDALEISLGARGKTLDDSATITVANGKTVQPADNDISWTNKEVISSYYGKVGKLMPSSSVDATNLYYALDVNAGGRNATNFVKVGTTPPENGVGYKTATNALWSINTDNKYLTTNPNGLVTSEENNDAGFYIDVPVWLRTTKLKGTGDPENATIYCALKISRKTDAAAGVTPSEELYKAVRVAFIPATGTDGGNITASTSNITVFGISNTTYGVGLTNNADTAVAKAGNRSENGVLTQANVEIPTSGDVIYADLNQTIPYATADTYGEQAFIVRVWLEGEDVNCWDGTSNQDWNIDFAFSLSQFDENNRPAFNPA